MRKAFTVLELLIASLLLSMLVVILTTIFNQSSVAWTTCLASESELSGLRVKFSAIHDVADDLLPGLGQDNVKAGGDNDNRKLEYRTVSVFKGWDGSKGGFAYDRAYDKFDTGQLGGFISQGLTIGAPSSFFAAKSVASGAGGARGANVRSSDGLTTYVVGVRSYGPDGPNGGPDDDITSYPESAK